MYPNPTPKIRSRALAHRPNQGLRPNAASPHAGSRAAPESLSGGLADLCLRAIDTGDRTHAATLLLDWLGCALAATGQSQHRALVRWARDAPQSGRSTAFGLGQSSAEQAAFVNGGLGNILEMDDLHRASILHAGDVILPAALAQAQAADVTGTALLDAIVSGYDVALRLGRAAAVGGYSAWYNSAVCGVFGAAMACARLRGASRDQMLDALGQAGMQAAGVWQCRLEQTDSKQVATAQAARAGVTSAALALAGLRGARHILDGPLGIFATYYPDADQGRVLSDPDGPWLLHEVSLKPWPACRHTHAAIHLALGLRDRIDPAKVTRIEIGTYAAGVSFCTDPAPDTDHRARFSFEHCVAVALERGAPGLADFGAAARDDAEIRRLRGLTTVQESPALSAAFPGAMGARLSVRQTGAAALMRSTRHAPGDPELPLGLDAVQAKFRTNTGHAGLRTAAAGALINSVSDLPGAASLAALNTALAGLGPDVEQTEKGPCHA
ncbi:MmgE/PrpD family protein [Sulfitobacter sabulilitoris]|nr:MmgE/PrpD family protein [Sulfitobacter sabulilitoris]